MFSYSRAYTGSVQLVVFDWAGTVIDHGSVAPAAAFIEGYKRKGIEISIAQARGPMGMGKWDHIKAIGNMPAVTEQWISVHGQPITDVDVDEMYNAFVPVLMEVLPGYCTLISGTVTAVEELRGYGIKIAGTTGYFKEAMDLCGAEAAKQGYTPDTSLAATMVSAGRPAPWLIYRSMELNDVFPIHSVVKVGDTKPDIQAGLNAGVWTIGVAQAGNEVGLTQAELDSLDKPTRIAKINAAKTALAREGAHYVVDGVWDIPNIIKEINARLAAGDRP
ncbi:MAG: phosphonoacetaldehyde hydrolase [Chloroflexota bacterium]